MSTKRQYWGEERSEARVTTRYPLVARVAFRWKGIDERWCQGTGVTHDISSSGAWILADAVPPLGAEVEVTVMWTSAMQGALALGRLSGKGTVVRVTDAPGFAAAVTFHILKAEERGTAKEYQ